MKFIVGSKNPVKIQSVEACVKKCIYFNGIAIEIVGQKIASGVPDMPINFEQIIGGAKNRAHNLKSLGLKGDYYVGSEGGTIMIGDKAYLLGCTFVLNNHGESHFGLSPWIEVPKIIQERIYLEGGELGPIQDEISGEKGLNRGIGSYAIWTDNMISRQESFESAFISAIAPFYNKSYK